MSFLYQRNPRKGATSNLKLISGRNRSSDIIKEMHTNFWKFPIDARIDGRRHWRPLHGGIFKFESFVLWETGRVRWSTVHPKASRFNRGKYWAWGK